MHLELAEAAGEGDVGGGRDVLVAEHEHLVAYQGLAQLGDGVVVERVVEVDRGHFGADVRGDRREVERDVRRRGHRSAEGQWWWAWWLLVVGGTCPSSTSTA